MRAGIPLLMFCLAYNIGLYKISHEPMEDRHIKMWNYYPILFLLTSNLLTRKYAKINYWERQILAINELTVLFTIVCILLVQHMLLIDPYQFLWTFNGLIFATTFIVVVNGARHGIFKYKHNGTT